MIDMNIHYSSSSSPLASSFSSPSTTDIDKIPHCVSLQGPSLSKRGYNSFEDWNSNPNHIYIGRNMSHRVPGALGSKWGNPFTFRRGDKNSLKQCLEKYENYIRRNPDLFNAVVELEGKEIGCWCKPLPCHGDILIKLFKERQNTSSSLSKSNQEFIPVPYVCGNGDDDGDVSSRNTECNLSTSSSSVDSSHLTSSILIRQAPHSVTGASDDSCNLSSSDTNETSNIEDPTVIYHIQDEVQSTNLTSDAPVAEDTVTYKGTLNSTIEPETPTLLSRLNLSDDLEVSIRSIGSIPLTESSPAIIDGIMTPNISDNSISEFREACNSNTPDIPPIENLPKADNTLLQIKNKIDNSCKHRKYGRSRPQTQVFSQGKTYTYNKLEVPSPNKCSNKSTMTPKKPDSLLLSRTRPCETSLVPKATHPKGKPFTPPKGKPLRDGDHCIINPDAFTILKNMRIENLKNIIIGQLNINSLRNKFCDLAELIKGKLDILVITETKLDYTFPEKQFLIPGYKKPFRADRNKDGGGVMIYVREDIPCDKLLKHSSGENIEAIFL